MKMMITLYPLDFVLLVLECAVICYLMFMFLRNMKRTVWQRKRYYIAAYVVSVILCVLLVAETGGISILFFFWIGGSLIGYFLYDQTFRQILRMLLLSILLWVLLDGASLIATGFLRSTGAGMMGEDISRIVAVFMKDIIVVAGARAAAEITGRKNRQGKGIKGWILSLVVFVVSLLFIVFVLNIANVYLFLYDEAVFMISVLFLIILLINIFVSDFWGILVRNKELQEELRIYQQQAQLQYKYYQNLEEKYQNSRKLIHDIRNHLHAVESLYHMEESEAGSRYTRDIHGKLNLLGQQYYCDNKMLNIILNDKLEKARIHGISVKVHIGENNMSYLPDIDITTIFANLLDNAITAASEVEQNSCIQIKIEQFHDFLAINIRNSCRRKNTYESRKRGSGIGLKNVKSVLKKHDGTMEIRKTEDSYQVHIVIPISE